MKVYFSLIIILCVNAIVLPQPIRGVYYHAYSNTLVLTVEGAVTWEQTDYSGNTFDYLGKASLEYFLPSESRTSFGLRAFGGSGFISGKDEEQRPDQYRTTIKYLGGGIVFIYSLSKSVFPYFFGGASYLWFDPRGSGQEKLPNNRDGVYKKEEINYNAELGFRFLITDDFSFNINGAAHVSPNDYLDDYATGISTDLFYSIGAGFSYSFFSEKDEDGVPDYLDLCANTPKDIPVDKFGCPTDSDGDGVPDFMDECPNTPKGISVDKNGCSMDSDGDGVIDSKDICPNTPLGKKVDENGCELKEEVQVKEVVLSSGATFAFGQSSLLPAVYPELDKLVKVMIENPTSHWRIEGHTDDKGPDWANKKISQERAESVLRYFVSRGISSDRFVVVGLGKNYPIADNLTSEGMAKNRRVVIIRID